MKAILCALVVVLLQALSPAHAYEEDVHYSITYVLARAAGWSEADARIIASANQGVDENPDTIAALELDATPGRSFVGYVMGSLRQSEKNLEFHCFSKTRGHTHEVSADVRKVIADHFAAVPGRGTDPQTNTRRLIALGVALHCQQDAYSHVESGGSCGAYSGSCYGHTHQTFLDQMIFSLLGKHLYNPDHPGVSGERLLEALEGTARELTARVSKAAARSIPSSALVALSDGLRGSGLELPDDVRRECNRYIAGKWLFERFSDRRAMPAGLEAVDKLAPEVAHTCKNAALGSATIVRIPEPRFPRLNDAALPRFVRADGTYQLLHAGDVDLSLPRFSTEKIAGLLPNYDTQKIRVQLSHWRQLLALPLAGRAFERAPEPQVQVAVAHKSQREAS